ncbi:unnamed protein product [Cylicocyclus nassatus]|uniref:BPTI/Kunitz inhibitor domain-containing protein n=1 Tax=Cylicocyclus nassatus TaxID=53992 RepID=A0AA36HBM8_CYLNA|nr:unnamed protein product [Cylicocyclus nassatus]
MIRDHVRKSIAEPDFHPPPASPNDTEGQAYHQAICIRQVQMKSFILSSVILYSMLRKTDSVSDCLTTLDRGDNTSCSNANPGIRYYHDVETDICFPFLYKGCGGNSNNYATMKDCYIACPPEVMFHCLGKTPKTGTCDRDMKGCKSGSVCLLRAFGPGICCDMANEAEWLEDFECRCSEQWKEKEWNDVEHLLGKTCSHEFCPKDFDCKQGYHLAHCCPKEKKEKEEKGSKTVVNN